jgi:DNA-binding NarL/FixJ family response regulator
MGARRTDMHRLQEVIRLHRLGKSSRRIARHLSMGRDTIREYLAVLSDAGLLAGPIDELPELDVLSKLVREHAALCKPVLILTVRTTSEYLRAIWQETLPIQTFRSMSEQAFGCQVGALAGLL